jgi:hypothetical protein
MIGIIILNLGLGKFFSVFISGKIGPAHQKGTREMSTFPSLVQNDWWGCSNCWACPPFSFLSKFHMNKDPLSLIVGFLNLSSISSSIAGLAVARVCHDHFECVIIVEPEAWLVTPEGQEPAQEPVKKNCTRIMQYQSLHGKSYIYAAAAISWLGKKIGFFSFWVHGIGQIVS